MPSSASAQRLEQLAPSAVSGRTFWLPPDTRANIQGLVMRSYGRRFPFAAYAILTVTDAGAARAFVGRLIDETSGLPQIQFASTWTARIPLTCLNIGFTYAGLTALGVPSGTFSDSRTGELLSDFEPFVRGSWSPTSAGKVGDLGRSDPANWIFSDRTGHVVLSIFGQSYDLVQSCLDELRHAYAAAFAEVTVVQSQDVLGNSNVYFGYHDGIAQPTLMPDNPSHEPPDGGQLPVDPGAFVLGQSEDPNNGYYRTMPIPNPSAMFEYGSFAALRMLNQDVDQFDKIVEQNYAAVATAYAIQDPDVAKAALKALFIGRWPNGNPLMLSPITVGMTAIPEQLPALQLNDFGYMDAPAAGDPTLDKGVVCPYDAHVRRANPRNGIFAGALPVNVHRIIRRAFPYQSPYVPGSPDENERGLLGYFISASLQQGFELVMADWVQNRGGTPALDPDPVLGHNLPPAPPDDPYTFRFKAPPSAPAKVTCNIFAPLTTTRGSAYVYLPGRPGIDWIARNFPA
jgi:deferrochelatase/peroxidase EfeB